MMSCDGSGSAVAGMESCCALARVARRGGSARQGGASLGNACPLYPAGRGHPLAPSPPPMGGGREGPIQGGVVPGPRPPLRTRVGA
eukprot:416119-Pyramimonas_sp.AAC.1